MKSHPMSTPTPEMTTETELRELDVYVCEHVMGWKKSDMMGLRDGRFALKDGTPYMLDGTGGIYRTRLFTPSTDAAAALQVLEACAGLHEPITIYKLVSQDAWSIKACICADDSYMEVHVHGETLPLAIAKFAKQLFSDRAKLDEPPKEKK